MSWNITGIGSKAAIKKQVTESFDRMIESSKGKCIESSRVGILTTLNLVATLTV
jgi:hypothetical protein